ncbi:hypothetical protein [Nocardioides sp. AX2bis]|uniref:hypothetical protein n=1 Tax=Nocardioides sp. AX2bis TaxID=2653157 RepID=UPI0012F2AA7E|nr:hypothetical protein [Nocardioides sp. AX2bis]VXC53124.1 hypothetical protein NOCARDAX2BIS_80041 [Nocardioides sp. AX2bis]
MARPHQRRRHDCRAIEYAEALRTAKPDTKVVLGHLAKRLAAGTRRRRPKRTSRWPRRPASIWDPNYEVALPAARTTYTTVVTDRLGSREITMGAEVVSLAL